MQMQCGAVAKVIVTPTFWPHFVECFCTAAAFSSCSSSDGCKKEFRVFIVCFSLCLIQATSVWPGHRQPLQQSMSASSSMLAATPPATPRSAAQPSPFEFPSLESGDQHKFRSLASFDEVQRDFNVNRSFDNVSPRPYLGIEGASPAHRFLYTPFVFVCQGVLPHDSIYINPNILRGDSVDLESWALRDYS